MPEAHHVDTPAMSAAWKNAHAEWLHRGGRERQATKCRERRVERRSVTRWRCRHVWRHGGVLSCCQHV